VRSVAIVLVIPVVEQNVRNCSFGALAGQSLEHGYILVEACR
jgi:hypothetical protein